MSRTWSAERSNRRATHRTARRGGRSSAKTKAVADELGAHCFVADFAHLHQVHTLAAQLADHCPRIHVLVNNAGAILGDRHVTADGFEETFQVNYLAPFLLTNLLLELRDVVARLTTTAPTAGGNGRSHRSGSTGRPWCAAGADGHTVQRHPWDEVPKDLTLAPPSTVVSTTRCRLRQLIFFAPS
ncbi:SDR family NAD(P)-dependent oxidoreductase [Streptomyces nigra]|uniref:SDR family NAD(P)-dependent oxidoreductase n=1 Tax=Streptomyces nigra TaxID=1827580 RepID=UPI0036C1552A